MDINDEKLTVATGVYNNAGVGPLSVTVYRAIRPCLIDNVLFNLHLGIFCVDFRFKT